MLITRSRRSLDDLPLEILSQIFVVLGTTCINMIEGMGPKNLNVDSFICTCALQKSIEAMFRKECFYYGHFVSLIGPHQCDEGLQLLDTYFGWVVPDDWEYTGVVDSAKELLRAVDIVHGLTANNITFRCEDPRHSIKGAFAIGHEEDKDRQRYCTFMPHITNSKTFHSNQ
uniref:Uncharacterized protein n=1 Tax=Lactuca sativa TaxID=4236 RepID=A0A9R1VY22_LACSA|nr:hypothetical protein LSAT_V11C400211970 [Lactuca sativa]